MGTFLKLTAQARPPAPTYPEDLERRRCRRIHTVMRVARVERESDAGLWRVRNISDDGMLLTTGVPVTPGEPMTIGLSERTRIDARAIWWDGQRCGVTFDRPIDCIALLHDLVDEQRSAGYRPPRLAVDTRAVMFGDHKMHTIRLCNLSQHGAGFHHDGAFHPGMRAKLLFANGEERRGVVRWSNQSRAGMYLLEPFPCAQLESARRL